MKHAALFPDEWLVYSTCSTLTRCKAELRYEGLPGRTLAIDRYRVRNGKAHRVGVAHIEVTLETDRYSDCSGKYVGTGNVSALMACASR